MHKRLKTKFLGVELESPLVLPAGVMGMSFSGMDIARINGAGIITSKSLTLQPRTGHKGPVIAEFEGGILNCMGLCNPGISNGLLEVNEFKKRSRTPVIVSVFATNTEDFLMLAKEVNNSRGDFLELNLSCPNVFDEFGIPLAASKDEVFKIVKAVKESSRLPVIAKLSPNVYNIVEIALAAQKAGADALCLINTVGPGMAIDAKMVKPVLFNKFGGLSGPCIKPIALKLIYQTHSAVDIPILGMGGVTYGIDAVEMLMAGATTIGVGTAVYYRGIEVFEKINNEIIEFLDENGYETVEDILKLEKLKL
ncbi:MAG: dihydroorotate dehydrogenase [Candidatus Cloacimonetes bacterium]|nr:dihydroorotate dehydrogenase [Candidatus Cloacimonadota bacterium]MCF7812891.1 dihydroorotate dehydrogenase [Candidatus Cloacimonadota bacterium]MCF7867103.1 dihydroorotate dehydrogenase [Candidatus Cloacimonadota bacterium]MCF7882577.1 dihydroorotate dehydrogenase [Candidatus Cloacimonadota bacterium]